MIIIMIAICFTFFSKSFWFTPFCSPILEPNLYSCFGQINFHCQIYYVKQQNKKKEKEKRIKNSDQNPEYCHYHHHHHQTFSGKHIWIMCLCESFFKFFQLLYTKCCTISSLFSTNKCFIRSITIGTIYRVEWWICKKMMIMTKIDK